MWRLPGQDVEPGSGQPDSERSEPGRDHHTDSSQDESKADSEREPLLAPGTERSTPRPALRNQASKALRHLLAPSAGCRPDPVARPGPGSPAARSSSAACRVTPSAAVSRSAPACSTIRVTP